MLEIDAMLDANEVSNLSAHVTVYVALTVNEHAKCDAQLTAVAKIDSYNISTRQL